MGSYSNKYWTCPFYGSSKKLCINCEGGRLQFGTWRDCSEYADKYCASYGWRNCTVAQQLLRKYEREENDAKRGKN